MGDPKTGEKNAEELLEKCGQGKLDHIIYTAGDSLAVVPLKDTTMEQVHAAGNVRFFGAVMIGKFAPKYLKEGPASSYIITTGAVSEKPIPNWTVVGAYATALQGLTRGLALDLAPIRVNLISPGGVDTELWNGMPPDVRAKTLEGMAQKSATGAIGTVVNVAEAYLYLMKDHNITGSIISTNSGSLIK